MASDKDSNESMVTELLPYHCQGVSPSAGDVRSRSTISGNAGNAEKWSICGNSTTFSFTRIISRDRTFNTAARKGADNHQANESGAFYARLRSATASSPGGGTPLEALSRVGTNKMRARGDYGRESTYRAACRRVDSTAVSAESNP